MIIFDAKYQIHVTKEYMCSKILSSISKIINIVIRHQSRILWSDLMNKHVFSCFKIDPSSFLLTQISGIYFYEHLDY
jgi:hypothetical protein